MLLGSVYNTGFFNGRVNMFLTLMMVILFLKNVSATDIEHI